MLNAFEIGGFIVGMLGFGLTKLGEILAVDVTGWILLGIGSFVALVAGSLDLVMKLFRD